MKLNEVSADIVRLLGNETTEADIVEALRKLYNTSWENLTRDVRKVTAHLRSEGLLSCGS